MGWENDPIVIPAPTPKKAAWENDPIVVPAAGPRVAHGIGAALTAGAQNSLTGLEIRGKLPDVVLNKEDSKWYERVAFGMGQVVSDLPAMAVAGAVGSLAGPIAGGAAAMGVPAAIREEYVLRLQRGEIANRADFFDRARIILTTGVKEAIVGGATAGAGKLLANTAEAVGLNSAAIGTKAAILGGEAAAMTTTSAALDGRMPEIQDATDAAILLVGLKGIHTGTKSLWNIYAKTGKTPHEVLADAKAEPSIVDDLLKTDDQGNPKMPDAYKEAAVVENIKNILAPDPRLEQLLTKDLLEIPPEVRAEKTKNIPNMAKIDTETDMDRLIYTMAVNNEANIVTASRGTVTHAQTDAEVKAAFKKVTGTAADRFLEGKGDMSLTAYLAAGQQLFVSAAEQTMAKRQAYLDAEAKGLATDEMKLDFMQTAAKLDAVGAHLQGEKAEVARALQITQRVTNAKEFREALKQSGDDSLTFDEKFNLMLDALGSVRTPQEVAKATSFMQKRTTWGAIMEGWKASILSGWVTQFANIAGNAVMLPIRPAVDAVAWGIGKATNVEDRIAGIEPLARATGFMYSIPAAFRQAAEAWMVDGKQQSRSLDERGPQIPGKIGVLVRTPFRVLSSVDAIFKTMHEQGEAYALASRQAVREGQNVATREFRERVSEIMQNPDTSMAKQIEAAGIRFTYQNKLGEAGVAFQQFVRKAHLEWLFPFQTSPANILKESIRMTPFAPVIGEWRADVRAGGPRAQKALAEIGVGAALSTFVFAHALDFNISGQGDPDPKKRAAMMANGWQPYSVKINNKWYSYQRLGNFGSVMGMAADAASVWEHMNEDERDKIPKILAISFANAITNQSALKGGVMFANVLSDPDRYGADFINSYAGSVVPAFVAQSAEALDPLKRETYSMLDVIQSRIPIAREFLQPQVDQYGKDKPAIDRLFGVLPIQVGTPPDDKVRSEAARLGVAPARTPETIEVSALAGKKTGEITLTPEQRTAFARAAGDTAYHALAMAVNSPGWDDMPDMDKADLMKTVFTKSQEFGRFNALTPKEMLDKYHEVIRKWQKKREEKIIPKQ